MRKVKVRCPACGLLVYTDRFNKSYAIEAFLHEFGGRVRGINPATKKPVGIMRYTPIAADPYRALVEAALRKAADAYGFKLIKK